MSRAVVVPALGVDAAFDEMAAKALEALTAAGNPEGIDEATARTRLAEAMARVPGGRTFSQTEVVPKADDAYFVVPPQVRELRIPEPTEAYWYLDPDQAGTIRHFILMRRALGSAFHGGLLIEGGAGYGKTLMVQYIVALMNTELGLDLNLFRMNCSVQSDPQKWFGRREIDKAGSRYEKSDFINAIEAGWIVQLDEANRIHPHIANSIHSLLDGTQELALPDLNLTIEVNPAAVFIATMNVGSQYGGTHRLDQAFRSRFSTTIEVGPPPRDEEIKVVSLNTGCDMDAAATLVDIAQASRGMFSTGDLRSEISTRDLVAAGRWVAAGKTERQALEITVLPMFDGDANGTGVGAESDRAKVRRIIEGKGR